MSEAFSSPFELPLPDFSPRAEAVGLLKRLSARHHRLAQALAEGIPPGEAGTLCGYTASRVSVLQTDPSFRELIHFYKAAQQEAFLGTARKLAEVADTAVEILQDRLEEKPDEFTVPQLLSVITTAADRTGLGPTQTQRNVSVVVSAEQLEQLKARVGATQTGSVKLISAQSANAGSAGEQSAPAEPQAEEPSGKEGSAI